MSNTRNLTEIKPHKFKNGDEWVGRLKNGRPYGEGEYRFENGDVYEGPVQNGKAAGYGKLTYVNKDVYEGNFEDGYENNQGKITYVNGDVYEGNFEGGFIDGQGTLTYKNGNIHKGIYKKGLLNGQGERIDKKSNFHYSGEYKNGVFDGKGTLKHDEIDYTGEFRNGKPYNPNLHEDKKNQKILLICQEKEKEASAYNSLKERYEEVFFYDEVQKDEDLIEKLTSNSTKGDKETKKLKIVINEHGNEDGDTLYNDYIVSLNEIRKSINKHNKENHIGNKEKLIFNIDIVLNVCYGSKVVSNNRDFQKLLKNLVQDNITVKISTGDEKFTASSFMVNNKNSMPTSKTDGYYIINEFRFTKKSDLNQIRPYKTKKYKTVNDFLKDNYEGKNNILFSAFRKTVNYLQKPSKQAKEKASKERIRKKTIEAVRTKNLRKSPQDIDMSAKFKTPINSCNKSKVSDVKSRKLELQNTTGQRRQLAYKRVS